MFLILARALPKTKGRSGREYGIWSFRKTNRNYRGEAKPGNPMPVNKTDNRKRISS